eukprot:CAMPEP_0170400724 /NCGR_PEP_ID=MMETSP0117_2-20130122/24646_1 /TAXON_ID=400756 /ORGANISM="Durinskia baltica, Strain CSIRO CS-38" /LENGTH=385 /DNA_ID=CAMNT_0010657483 /DNA_START=63 /DNA_END=1220 /DNA_ORIENTATION=-
MDRTEELVKATQLFQSIDRSKSEPKDVEQSAFILRAENIATDLEQNQKLVRRMHTLSDRKEFSNDPLHEMKSTSAKLQANITTIENSIAMLKKETTSAGQSNATAQHRKLILEFLDKTMRKQVSSYKEAVKTYSANVEQRNKRVEGKYGAMENAISIIPADITSKYAMFNVPSEPPSVGLNIGSQMRNRRGGAGGGFGANAGNSYVAEEFTEEVSFGSPPTSSSGMNAGTTSIASASAGTGVSAEDDYDNKKKYGKLGQMSTQPPGSGKGPSSGSTSRSKLNTAFTAGLSHGGGGYDRYRLQQAQQAESTIAQMGQLFSQMATLVSEQSEVIMRIEDDVESGLQETVEAQGHMQNVYDITKGNRGLILKIFAVLVGFIFLFLVWT